MKEGQDWSRVEEESFEVVAVTLFGKIVVARYATLEQAEWRARDLSQEAERNPRGYPAYGPQGIADAAIVELCSGGPTILGTRRRLDGDGVPAVRRGAGVLFGIADRVILVCLRAERRQEKERR
jgi:hypothetical protein